MGQGAPMALSDPSDEMSQEASIEALTMGDMPLRWKRLDDTVMGGKSHTHLVDACYKDRKRAVVQGKKRIRRPQKLCFEGTIDTTARIGFASVRATLPSPLVTEDSHMPQSLSITARGDGLTYKVLLMDKNHGRWGRSFNSPLWEADLRTCICTKSLHTWTIPFADFTPTFMGRPANIDRFQLIPSQILRIGFMLSSRLSNGSRNPSYDTQPEIFDFCLEVHDVKVVPDVEFDPNSIIEDDVDDDDDETV